MKEEKAKSILNTAKKMFGRYGLQKTTLDEIARVARVARATIYNYFGSKDRVYPEVLRREANEIVKKISLSVDQEDFSRIPPFLKGVRGILPTVMNYIRHALRGFELNWLVHESEEQIERHFDELMNIVFYGLMSGKRGVNA